MPTRCILKKLITDSEVITAHLGRGLLPDAWTSSPYREEHFVVTVETMSHVPSFESIVISLTRYCSRALVQ